MTPVSKFNYSDAKAYEFRFLKTRPPNGFPADQVGLGRSRFPSWTVIHDDGQERWRLMTKIEEGADFIIRDLSGSSGNPRVARLRGRLNIYDT